MSTPEGKSDSRSQDLDRAALRGTGWLERQNSMRSWKAALADTLSELWVVPLTLLFVYVVALPLAALFGWRHPGFAWPFVVVLTAVYGCIRFGFSLRTALRKEYERKEGLALLDERFELADRLQTADAFLNNDHEGLSAAFASAAIADADQHLEKALGATIADDPSPWTETRRVRNWLVVAGVLAAIALLVPAVGDSGADLAEDGVRVAGSDQSLITSAVSEDPPAADAPPASVVATRDSEPKNPNREAAQAAEAGEPTALPEEAKETDGKSSRGESGEASSAAGSSEARGVPSDQGQSSKSSAKKKPAKKKKAKKKAKATDQDPTKKKEGEKSGSTAGLGSASGSNKNPASTSWSSKDQVTDTEDEDIEDDEEVEDEDSESEARGGIQPTLRDRKPAASRDLSIGFGNRPSPNARGRGGPSQQKKSRGTASLILGVPIPDHIKGQPNAGKTKITQERIEPKADPLTPGTASPRNARSMPAGRVPETTLEPWMRDLVRDFFLEVRAATNKKPTPAE